MGVKEATKKFVGEPLIWVGMAMVGVVLMGPTAANLARKVVGGDRNRGDVDQHGETITSDLPLAQKEGAADDSSDDGPSHRLAMRDDTEGTTQSTDDGWDASSVQRNDNSDLTAADIRAELARRQQEAAEGQSQSPSEEPASGASSDAPAQEKQAEEKPAPQEESFDVDQMVEDVKREMESASKPPKESDVAGDSKATVDAKSRRDKVEDLEAANGSDTTQKPSSKLPSSDSNSIPAERDKGTEKENSVSKTASDDTQITPLPKPDVSLGQEESADEEKPATELSQKRMPAEVDSDNDWSAEAPRIVENDFYSETGQPEMASDEGENELAPNSGEIVVDNDDQMLAPWDEPVEFESETDSESSAQNQFLDNDYAPVRDFQTAMPAESGDTWWDASIAQQFWPDRQAQFASIDSVVFVALQNSAQIQILNDQPQIEETFVNQREADFDWSAFVDASWNSVDEPVRSELQTGSRTGRFAQEELFVGSGLQKKLERGGEVRVGSTVGTVDNNSIFLAPPDQGTASFSLDYRQPLLRGRGREVTQSQVVLARLNVEASRHSVKQQVQQYVVAVVTAYWELYRARGVLSQRHRNYVRATEIVEQLSSRTVRSGATSQVRRAQAAASARHSEVIDAEYVVADAQERLMNLTHGDHVANSGNVEIIPTDAPPQFMLPHDLGSATESAIRNRAEVKEVLAEIKAASVRKIVAIDGLKPQLDAIISSYVAGVRGDKDVGNAIYDQFSAGDPSYSVGMSFEIPIGRRSANAGMKREEIHRRLLQNKLRKTLGDVSTSARSAFRDVYRLMSITDNNRQVVAQSAENLNAILEEQEWLEKDGPSAALFLNDLLGSQDRLLAAEQNLLDSQAQLAIAYVTLKRATGELLQDSVCTDGSGCQSCGSSDCGCSTVTQASWSQPIEESQTIFEKAGDHLDGLRNQFRPSPSEHNFDIPVERPNPQPGVTPMPAGSNTAGEFSPAPRAPRSTRRTKMKPAARY